MKNKLMKRFFALIICAALFVTCFPLSAFAEEAETVISMIEGEVRQGFVPEGTACTSGDASVAWVDESGNLNAMKSGTTNVSVVSGDGAQTDYTVTVEDFSDGSEIVGNLKILARYNDSMQFYDGHVYLLFTSYQDGVTVSVPDLYAGYEISDQYYTDIRESIANGSNHSGNDTDEYFTFDDEMTSVTLDRGEIVTIGMYRDFDLSVPQAALGSIQNSSAWAELQAEGKTAVVKTIFGFLESGQISTQEAVDQLKAVFEEIGMDYNKLLDGVVDGGVCFNRELYNQKLEWDQYENVTYEMDITGNQLNIMTMYLGGNLNKFSILKNSCATVALRAWNAAVGTRNGAPTAYQLSSTGTGIFALIDAPKGVRDSIVSRLPGYYLNNAEGVAEPDAGYQDETGWVYVSAPEKVTPVTYFYDDEAVLINESYTKISTLVNAAKAGQSFSYAKDAQEIGVSVKAESNDDLTTVSGVDFTINGTTVSLNGENMPEDGIWFKLPADEPADGEYYCAYDAENVELPCDYNDGWLSICTDVLPFSYRFSTEPFPEDEPGLSVTVFGADDTDIVTEIYYKDGDEIIPIEESALLPACTKVFIKSSIPEDDNSHVLKDILFLEEDIFDGKHYDAEEDAYFVITPEEYAGLTLIYGEAVVYTKGENMLQIAVGDTLDVLDCARMEADYIDSDQLKWKIIDDENGIFGFEGEKLKAVKAGGAYIWACAKDNENIGVLFSVEVYENADDMVTLTFGDGYKDDYDVALKSDNGNMIIPFSGYKVRKGSELTVVTAQEESKAILFVQYNGKNVPADDAIFASEDAEIKVSFAEATVQGMPKTVKLASKEDTYQFEAKVSYSGLNKLLPVYDSSVRYESSDPLASVDENGLVTVTGEIPEDGVAIIVTAYAGSSNDTVFAQSKVVVGDYKGDKIVGRITVAARRIYEGQLVAHSMFAFMTYEDVDLNVSYYEYYKPNDKYNSLMSDYEEHPENYTSDPALYNDNELGLEDRDSYFDVDKQGVESDPQTISLTAGETVTLSNYGFERTNLVTVRNALEDSAIASSVETQELIRQLKLYSDGEEIDGVKAFDSMVSTIMNIIMTSRATGHNPAYGHSEGGLTVNRELYNQFRRSDSQLPNNYYTVEITADQMTKLRSYLADPSNNYYSLFAMNCATGVVNLWNTTLFDEPDLHLTANYTGVAADPQSMYFELGLLGLKKDLDGENGTDFYPRTVAYSDAVLDVINKINAIGEVEYTDDCKAKIDAAREAYEALTDVQKTRVRSYAALAEALDAYDALGPEPTPVPVVAGILGDADEDGEVTVVDATVIQRYLAGIEVLSPTGKLLADVDSDGDITIIDATYIQRYLASLNCPEGIGESWASD